MCVVQEPGYRQYVGACVHENEEEYTGHEEAGQLWIVLESREEGINENRKHISNQYLIYYGSFINVHVHVHTPQ